MNYNTVAISSQSLHVLHLTPFKAAVDAGALAIMTAFNDVNGVPATGNPRSWSRSPWIQGLRALRLYLRFRDYRARLAERLALAHSKRRALRKYAESGKTLAMKWS